LVNWQYLVLKPAQRYLERMQRADQEHIVNALDALITDPTTLDIKPLQGRSEQRLRVGKYRILFVKDEENKIYLVSMIRSRGDVYKYQRSAAFAPSHISVKPCLYQCYKGTWLPSLA